MVCCYQVTEIFSTRYGFAIASSAWGPENFGPFTDLAISVIREMSMNIVITQNLTSPCSRLQRKFMRRTGVRASLYWNFIIHQIFPEFLQHSGISESPHGFHLSIWVSCLFGFGISLAWVSSGFPDLSSTKLDTGTGETVRCIFPFSNRNLIY